MRNQAGLNNLLFKYNWLTLRRAFPALNLNATRMFNTVRKPVFLFPHNNRPHLSDNRCGGHFHQNLRLRIQKPHNQFARNRRTWLIR